MKKKIFIIVSLLVILLVSTFIFADGTTSKWRKPIPIRGKFMKVESHATNPVNVRWDYFVYENGRIRVITTAPGNYPGKYKEDENLDFEYFYDVDNCNPEEFKIQKGETFYLPKSVWNFYVKCSDCEVKVEKPMTIIIKDMEK